MKIALAQITCIPGDVSANVAKLIARIAEAASAKCEAIVFPEMSDTGYDIGAILEKATVWSDPAGSFAALAEAARRHRIAVVAGLAERVGDDVYNAVAVLDSQGRPLAKGRKTHLMNLDPIREAGRLRAGDGLVTFELGGFKFGILVCYEIRFPEIARALALAGAEVLVVPAAFPAGRVAHWNVLTEARAIENQAYVLAVNRSGIDAGIPLGGNSRAIDPWGIVEADAAAGETTCHVTLERGRLERVRSGLRVFADRREAVYRNVASGTGDGMSSGKPR